MMKNYYNILKVSQDAPIEVIRVAYKVLCQKYHPDKFQNSVSKDEAEKIMRLITEAYAVLSDSIARKEYDEQLNNYFQRNSSNQQSKKTTEKKENQYTDEKPVEKVNYHAWRRFFARITDIYTLGFLWMMLIGIVLAHFEIDISKLVSNDIVAGWIVAFSWIPVEAILLSAFGTTPAKWIFGISVTTLDGNRLSFSQAFKRSFLVAFQGMSLGIITQAFAEHRLSKTGTTLWDSNVGLVVSHKDWGIARGIICITITLVAIFCVSIIDVITKTQNVTQKYNTDARQPIDWSKFEIEKVPPVTPTKEQIQAQEEAVQQAIINRYPVLVEMEKDPVKWAHAGKIYDAMNDNPVSYKWSDEQKIFKLNEFVTTNPLFYNSDDQFDLGASYEYGKDFPADNVKAIYWYTKSAQQGNEKAKIALSRFNITIN